MISTTSSRGFGRAVSGPPVDAFLAIPSERARRFYGERLVSLAVFGSHASGRATPRSDIDLFVVLESAAPRRRLRLDEWDRLEDDLAPALEVLEARGWSADLSPVIRTREEAEGFSILYLDMTVDVGLLVDRGGFLAARLERMRAELARLGAERQRLVASGTGGSANIARVRSSRSGDRGYTCVRPAAWEIDAGLTRPSSSAQGTPVTERASGLCCASCASSQRLRSRPPA
jgi:uncharacterized protein